MIAVIFEVTPHPEHLKTYLDIATALKPELIEMDGFISIERYQSLTTPGKVVSLSFWRDEEAVAEWRNREAHRTAQTSGRAGILSDYRLRVAHVVRDYGLKDRDQAPLDNRTAHG